MVASARRLALFRWVYCRVLRSSPPAAWQLHYILPLIGERTVLLDSSAGTGADAIGAATAQDTLLAVSVAPYTRQTVEIVQYANAQAVPVVAITDSLVSLLAKLAVETVVVDRKSTRLNSSH